MRKKGLIALIVVLAITVVSLSGIIIYKREVVKSDVRLENVYRQSFLDTVFYVDQIDNDLSKVLVTTDREAEIKYFMNIAVCAEVLENNLVRLPLQDEEKHYTTKLANQIGDYSKALAHKLIDGKELEKGEVDSLRTLKETNLSFKNALEERLKDGDIEFSKLNKKGPLLQTEEKLKNISVTYPELIYDGPFSDGKLDREVKGLTESEISLNKATELAKKYLEDYGVKTVVSEGESSGQFEVFNFSANENGKEIYLSLSKKGGKLVQMTVLETTEEINLEKEEGVTKGLEFLSKLGIENMREVWQEKVGNTLTVNYATEVNGVICYPDLIKVKISLYDGSILGYEAKTYYLNHTERKIESATLTKEEALSKINDLVDVYTVRLSLIPIGESGEALAYEIMGKIDGETYYYYIDAKSGKQVELFRVVLGTEGELLV
ncbi:MAG: germination protein YpeB [Clostridia bacterium]|nr:germination protein YpeB [Clostridia bacterium]